MASVKLTQGLSAIIDDRDILILGQFRWVASHHGSKIYAKARVNGRLVYMHRFLMGLDGREVDHINGNGLDNRKENLRHVTRTENNLNRAMVRGCYYEARTNRYRAEIHFGGRRFKLGRFETQEQATDAYLQKRSELLSTTLS